MNVRENSGSQTKMARKNRGDALSTPMSHSQATVDPNNYDLLTGSTNEGNQALDTRVPYNELTSALDGASHEQKGFAPVRAGGGTRRQERIDDESSSKAKMWDPVKDCSRPNTIQAVLPGLLSTRHGNSEQSVDSAASGFASMGLHFSYPSPPYGQVHDSQQESTQLVDRGIASTSLHPSHQPDDTASEFQGGSSIGLLPYPQSYAMTSGHQGGHSIGSQPFQAGHSYDQSQCSHQQRIGHENIFSLHPYCRNPSGQQGQDSLESTMRGATLMGAQPRQAGNLLGPQENGQQFTGMEARMRPCKPLLSMDSDLLRQRRTDFQEANRPTLLSAEMSQASNIARYADTLDQQSNRAEAVRAYEKACALFQEVIIKSCSFEERVQCNRDRNVCLAHLDVLLRGSSASPLDTPMGQNDQQDDDGPGGGKPQYSLLEDFTLCRKAQEDVSWQEVAETPMFKGRRKHRSLSQRKHTIGKMGPRYQESERPFTEEENQKLCALGDSGKALGDIQRKFRSRNGEHCLKQYWSLKGYPATGRSRTSTSHQARSAPALHALSTEHTLPSSIVARHGENPFHPSTPIVGSVSSHRLGTGLPLRPNYHASSTSSPINQFVDALGGTDGDPASPEATGNKIKEWPIHSERWKLGASPSSSATTATSPTYSPITTSPLSSSAVMNSPLESYDSLDSLGAAANRVRKSQRTAQLEPG